MRRVLLFLPLVVCLVLGALFVKGLSLDPSELPSAKLGKPFPAFSLQSLENKNQLVTEQDFKGKVRLVNIWATWCPTCKEEHGYLNQLAANEGVEIIGINYKDERVKAVDWLKRYQDPYIINVFDGPGSLGLDLGVYGAPETYIIDSDGVIRHRHVGAVDANVWLELKPIMQSFGWNG